MELRTRYRCDRCSTETPTSYRIERSELWGDMNVTAFEWSGIEDLCRPCANAYSDLLVAFWNTTPNDPPLPSTPNPGVPEKRPRKKRRIL